MNSSRHKPRDVQAGVLEPPLCHALHLRWRYRSAEVRRLNKDDTVQDQCLGRADVDGSAYEGPRVSGNCAALRKVEGDEARRIVTPSTPAKRRSLRSHAFYSQRHSCRFPDNPCPIQMLCPCPPFFTNVALCQRPCRLKINRLLRESSPNRN